MLDVGASLRISSWSRWVFSWEVMRRVAMLLGSAPGAPFDGAGVDVGGLGRGGRPWLETDDGEGLRRRWSGGTVAC
jgi:hypothetical protein